MEKAKRSPFMRIAGVMLGASLLMTCVISGTMAKYTSAATGTATATVAKWSFKVNNTEIAVTPAATIDFDLFETVKEADTTTAEENVTDGKIAPGTGGSFKLEIANESEVDAKYTIALAETNTNNVPIQYSLDKTAWTDDLTAINTDQTDVEIEKSTGTKTVTVYWRWMFEGTAEGAHAGQTDDTDTALGVLAQGTDTAPTVTISATITATQVD